MKASPMKPPIGSTSSLMMVAVSDDLTVRRASGVKRSTMANRSKRMRRSMRSPSTPLATLIQYLNAPLMMTKNRKSAGQAQQQADAADLEALEDLGSTPPPSQSGSSNVRGRNGAVGLPVPEGLALDGLVHDLARQIERREIKRQRREHDGADEHLVALRMGPDITEQALFHWPDDITNVHRAIGFQRPLSVFDAPPYLTMGRAIASVENAVP